MEELLESVSPLPMLKEEKEDVVALPKQSAHSDSKIDSSPTSRDSPDRSSDSDSSQPYNHRPKIGVLPFLSKACIPTLK